MVAESKKRTKFTKSRGQLIKPLPSKNRFDHILSDLRVVGTTIPVLGAIAALITEKSESHTDRAIAFLSKQLAECFERVNARMDSQQAQTDEFIELYKNAAILCTRTTRERKLKAAAEILTNALLGRNHPNKKPFDELQLFMRSVEILTDGALELLVRVYGQGMPMLQRGQIPKIGLPELREVMFVQDNAMLLGLSKELEARNFVSIQTGSVHSADQEHATLGLTQLGKRFTEVILRTAD